MQYLCLKSKEGIKVQKLQFWQQDTELGSSPAIVDLRHLSDSLWVSAFSVLIPRVYLCVSFIICVALGKFISPNILEGFIFPLCIIITPAYNTYVKRML